MADGLISESDAAHAHQFFDVAVAQVKTKVQPDSVADDLRGETMAAIESRSGVHRSSMPHVQICSTLARLS